MPGRWHGGWRGCVRAGCKALHLTSGCVLISARLCQRAGTEAALKQLLSHLPLPGRIQTGGSSTLDRVQHITINFFSASCPSPSSIWIVASISPELFNAADPGCLQVSHSWQGTLHSSDSPFLCLSIYLYN